MQAVEDSEYKCTLCAEVLSKAKEELNENPETRLIEVKTLRKRVEKVPGLKARTDVAFLLAVLRARKFDQERAYRLLMNYYETRQKSPDLFEDLKPSRVKHVFEDGLLEVLENRDDKGCKVIVLRPGRWDPDKYSNMEIVKGLFTVLSSLAEDEETQVHGIHIINNLKDMAWKHATHITPMFAKKVLNVLQEVLPLRLKRLDYMNEPTFFDMVFSIMKQFMKAKLVKRIHLNGAGCEKLHQSIKPEQLPTDLGGPLPMFNNKVWTDAFLASDPYFEDVNRFGFVNMSLDPDKNASRCQDAEIAGMGGTFKKLDI